MNDETRPPKEEPSEVERLRARNAELEREVADLKAKLTALDAQFRRFLRRVLAPRSEKLIHEPGQQRIDGITDVAPEPPALIAQPTPAANEKTATGKPPGRPRGRGLRTLPAHLDVVEERIELPTSQRVDHDGAPLVPVGTERAERLDWQPGRFIRLVTLRTRYGRMDTREPVITAPVPAAIVPRGLGGDRLVLHIAHQKYGLGLPLYRQRGDWLRDGVDLTTQTACSWMDHLARRLAGVVGAIRQQILAQPVLHLDDTPIRWWRPGQRPCRTARLWCYTAADQVFFDFTDSRAGHWPRDLLGGYRGHIVADAYGGHDRLFTDSGGTATEVGCWAHARRPFRELVDRSPQALEMVQLIQGLYAIDDVADTLAEARGTAPADERAVLRRSQAPGILAAIDARAQAIIATEPHQSELADGARYLRAHWTALTRFVDDPRLPLDNNAAERQQRPIAVGRKNWLFVASEDGGHWAASLLGIFQSCRLQHIDPIAYLTDIMPAAIAGDVDPLDL
ncbi:MAG: IS66 family transposase, partial [Alphaproteobacteria bacterium]|nr:IS66 family transposase [Alphaproteobacteria bacterium]